MDNNYIQQVINIEHSGIKQYVEEERKEEITKAKR